MPVHYISDWMMPDLDGLGCCRRIRAERRRGYTYIVLRTSRAGKANYLEALSAGADDFITKPFEKDASSEHYALAAEAEIDDFLTKSLDREGIRMRRAVAERILKYTAEIRHLQEFLPICVYCWRGRDEQDFWEQVETYIQKETGSRFSLAPAPNAAKER